MGSDCISSWSLLIFLVLWIIQEIVFDQKRDLKKKRRKIEGGIDYLEIKRKIRTEMKTANETKIEY